MNKGIVIFVEGDTEEEVYRKFLQHVRSNKSGRFNVSKLEIKNMKGIGNFKNKVIRVFTDILKNNPETSFTVFLCYDTDVEDFSKLPPINWQDVKKTLKKEGAKKIFEIKAKKSIEDWIIRDEQGLLNHLKLPENTKLDGNGGLEKIKNLFKKAKKVYVKGNNIQGLVDKLSMDIVMCSSCKELSKLCKELGIKCEK